MRAMMALRPGNWALDQEIAVFNPKTSSGIWAGKLNKSNAACCQKASEKSTFNPQLFRQNGCVGQTLDGNVLSAAENHSKPSE